MRLPLSMRRTAWLSDASYAGQSESAVVAETRKMMPKKREKQSLRTRHEDQADLDAPQDLRDDTALQHGLLVSALHA